MVCFWNEGEGVEYTVLWFPGTCLCAGLGAKKLSRGFDEKSLSGDFVMGVMI